MTNALESVPTGSPRLPRSAVQIGAAAMLALLLGLAFSQPELPIDLLIGVIALPTAILVTQAITRHPIAVILLSAVLFCTVAAGRTFSAIPIGPIYITEPILALTVVVALLAQPARRDVGGTTMAWNALLLAYVVIGVFAAVRGIAAGADLYFVARDATLVTYAPVAVLVALVFPRLSDAERLLRLLGVAGIAATAYSLLNAVDPAFFPAVPVGQAVGMSFFFIPMLAAWGAGQRIPYWKWAVFAVQIGLITGQTIRTSWVALLLAIPVIIVVGYRARWRRVALPLGVTTGVVLTALIWVLPVISTNSYIGQGIAYIGESAEGTVKPNPQGSAPSANSQWRLEFWKHDLTYTLHHPLGRGFGPGSNFCFAGECNDTRTSVGGSDPNEFTGPHNSYVEVAFRMGFPGLAVLVMLLYAAARGAVRRLRAGRRVGDTQADTLIISCLSLFAFAAGTCFFAVGLELPYIGLMFWTTVGLLLVCGRSAIASSTDS